MTNPRIVIYLENDDRKALFRLANTEKRDPCQQTAYVIRQQLESLGLLQPIPLRIEESESEYECLPT